MVNVRPAIRRLVHRESDSFTVYRRDEDTSEQYGTSLSYSALPEDRRIAVYMSSENEQPTMAGQRQAGALSALIVSNVDVQVNDRIDHGGERYEVTDKAGLPNERDPAAYQLTFDKP